jgi:hypothetical protein
MPSPASTPGPASSSSAARLRHDAWRARQWSWGFGGSYAILTAASLVIAPNMKDVASRPDIYVGAGSAGVGLGLIVLAPLTVMRDSDALEHHLAHAAPDVDRCRLLAIAEAMLIRDAQSEKFGRGWFTQTGNALLGVAAALILGLGYERWVSGVVNGIASIGVGELMILTQPIGLVRDLRNYRAGSLVVPHAPPSAGVVVADTQPRDPLLRPPAGRKILTPRLRTTANGSPPRSRCGSMRRSFIRAPPMHRTALASLLIPTPSPPPPPPATSAPAETTTDDSESEGDTEGTDSDDDPTTNASSDPELHPRHERRLRLHRRRPWAPRSATPRAPASASACAPAARPRA